MLLRKMWFEGISKGSCMLGGKVALSLERIELFSWDTQVNSLERVVIKSKPGCTGGHEI